MTRRNLVIAATLAASVAGSLAVSALAADRPFSTSRTYSPVYDSFRAPPGTGGIDGSDTFAKTQIDRFRCASSGTPTATVDMSCNTTELAQDFGPDNELAVAVDPANPQHVLAGSNDYFYRFNNSTGARQAVIRTGFFTSFDGGATWIDGQIPVRSGTSAGDPSPAFDRKHGVALMAQLENNTGRGGFNVTQGDISVSRSTDGGRTWSEPITVFHATGGAPATNAIFYDKEWITVDNNPGSPYYGRAYLTTSRYLSAAHGAYAESPIYLSYSDDGGATWSDEQEISGADASCTFQSTGPAGECDEDSFSYPEVAGDGTLYVHFINSQNEAAWEPNDKFDGQLMVVRSDDGGATFSDPVAAVQLEDGAADMPWSVIGRQTVWGHQLRWTSVGTISVDPTDADHVVVVFADRGTPNPNATPGCVDAPPTAPAYDPCDAGPGADLDVFAVESFDGGANWSDRIVLDGGPEHAWFPWADHAPDGELVVAYDRDDSGPFGTIPGNDTFHHVLWREGSVQLLGAAEHLDESVTHWSGQYVAEAAWPDVCGPVGYSDPPVTDAQGKDCNNFHGDYTGLAVDATGAAHVVWTGLNRFVDSPQLDPYVGGQHDGYAQDAMYARRP